MKVALYCRVSTDEQRINGYSIQAQLNSLREYAKKKDYIVVKEYLDEGYSGGTLNRPGLTRLLKDLDKFDTILFVKLDRWFRSVAHYYKIQEMLDAHNVQWVTTQEDYETITSSGKFKVNVMLSVSQQFKDATSERVKAVNDYKVKVTKEVICGKRKYGWDIIDKKYVVNKEEADKIVGMFKCYNETNSLRKTYEYYIENIGNIVYTTIKRKLTNRIYAGEFIHNGIVYTDYIPPIVDKELFDKVQERLKINVKDNTVHPKRYFIYSGLVKCSCCGKAFSGTYSNLRDLYYYRCEKRRLYECGNNWYVPEKYLENKVLELLISKTKDLVCNITEQKELKKKKSNKIPKLEEKLKRLNELYIDGTIDKDTYKLKYDTITKEIEKEKEINIYCDIEKYNYISSGDFLEMYNQLDREHKLLFNRDIIKEIRIDGNKNVDVILYD